jgi:uncharacterized protein YycO
MGLKDMVGRIVHGASAWVENALVNEKACTTSTPNVDDARRRQILSIVQPGDVFLGTHNGYGLWQAVMKLFFRSDYTHVGLCTGDGAMIDANPGDGVTRKGLAEHLHGPLEVAIVHPAYPTPQARDAAIAYANAQVGKPYDKDFDASNDDQHFCTEIVFDAVRAAGLTLSSPRRNLARYLLGVNVTAPSDFLRLPGAQVVYDDHSSYWKNWLSRRWSGASGT